MQRCVHACSLWCMELSTVDDKHALCKCNKDFRQVNSSSRQICCCRTSLLHLKRACMSSKVLSSRHQRLHAALHACMGPYFGLGRRAQLRRARMLHQHSQVGYVIDCVQFVDPFMVRCGLVWDCPNHIKQQSASLPFLQAKGPGLDSPGKTHGDDSLVPAWPKTMPGVPRHFAL